MIYLIFLEMYMKYGRPIIEMVDIERNMQALQKTQGIGGLKA